VGRQYIGEIGKTDNGIVVVTTHLYDGKKSLPLDIELRTYAGTLDIVVEELRLPNRKKPNNYANLSFEVEIKHQVSFTKLDYCQYLLSSQTNYTLTNLADHLQVFSHDTINRYLRGEKLTPRLMTG
jgi:hypothetical protein